MTSDLYSLWPDLALVAGGFHLNRPSMSDYLKVFFRLTPYLTWFDILTSAKVPLFVGIPKFISRKMYGIPKSSSWACRRILASRCENSSRHFWNVFLAIRGHFFPRQIFFWNEFFFARALLRVRHFPDERECPNILISFYPIIFLVFYSTFASSACSGVNGS